jgi:sucrose-6-phosphate hydrolase SacC (GH32 family)
MTAMKIVILGLAVFLGLTACMTRSGEILIADFEGSDFGEWTVSGKAFGTGPAGGTLPEQGIVSNFIGQGYVNSMHDGNASKGSLSSPGFSIKRDYINFLVGGGDFPLDHDPTIERGVGAVKGKAEKVTIDLGECCVNLVVDGEVLRTATGIRRSGADNEHLSWYTWDVRELRGKNAHIEIVDKNSGDFGHLTVDQVTQSDQRKMILYANELLTLANTSLEGSRTRAEADPTRPIYHLLPPGAYSNAAHGPVYHKGYYHVFYQVCPWGWGNGRRWYWGHWRSKDLAHWEQLPLMLWPSEEQGEFLVMAGTCVISDEGTPMIFYSSNALGARGIEQWVAIGDDDLLNWEKYPGNPLIEGHGVDPWIFREDGRWYMVLGGAGAAGRNEGGFNLHVSDDLINWEFLGYPIEGGVGERQLPSWEVPNLFKLDDKWVLVFEPHGPTKYVIGNFDLESYKFKPEHEGFMDYSGVSKFDFKTEGFIDMDAHFVGSSSMEIPDGRRIHFACVTGFDPDLKGPYLLDDRGWNGCMALPRVLSVRPDGRMEQQPIPELAELRGRHYSTSNIQLNDNSFLPDGAGGDTIEIKLEIEPGTANEIGLRVRRSNGGERYIPIRWDGRVLHLDDHEGPEGMLEGEDTLRLHVFLDRSVMEVFANDWVCFTNIIYPPETDLGVEVYAKGGTATVKSLDIWQMSTIW